MTNISRRSLLAGVSSFTIVKPELIRGAGKERLRAAVIGCGGRGTQAVVNLLTGDPNVELVAMADVFEDKLETSLRRMRDPEYIAKTVKRDAARLGRQLDELVQSISKRVNVDAEHRFTSFDAYKKVMTPDVDIVLLTTPPGYRPLHFEAAVNAGKHVFAEKPIATDAVGARRFIELAREAEKRKLTVVVGAQWVMSANVKETLRKIRDGAIGDIVSLSSRYLAGPVFHVKGRDPRWGDMEWQHRNWYSFLWLCGDQIVEQHIHGINLCNVVMGTHPVSVVASGGVAWRPKEELYGNIHDHNYSDFVYPNGVHLHSHCRQFPRGCAGGLRELIVGTKGTSSGRDMGQRGGLNAYVQEHIELVQSLRGDGPYVNQGVQVGESTLTAIMGREAAYSGLEITWDMIMKSRQDLQPKAFDYKLSMEVPELPVPGRYKFI